MTFGLSPKDWDEVVRLAIRPLRDQGAQVWVFGSRARGEYREFSDLDILYQTRMPLPPGLIAQIKEELEESRLPIKVDLVSEGDLAESFRESVFRDRVEARS